ncbi:hypothetical protein [Nocardioides taihuensis]|jgi:hypothetical protein|uniref:Uncharacterized protein n=1 Tax=Nocardioides taihuensis TaxID=1835606 RepID=A0ABW0BQC2_9ACTN
MPLFMEVLLVLFCGFFIALYFVGRRLDKHRGDLSWEEQQHKMYKNNDGGMFTL